VTLVGGIRLKNEREKWIECLKKHPISKMTVREWNQYAEVHSLPKSWQILYIFGSWNQMKQELQASSSDIKYQARSMSNEELLQIAKKHQEYFTTEENWNEYAKKHQLPSWLTYKTRFKRISHVKQLLGLPHRHAYHVGLTKEDIINIIKEHAALIKDCSAATFAQYLKEHHLPSFHHFRKHFNWRKIKAMAYEFYLEQCQRSEKK
jgi:hypothetical protein